MSGSHDDFFDFNHDGKLDALEWSAKMEFYDEISRDNSAKHNGTVRPLRKNRAGAGRPLQYKTGSRSGSNTAQKEKVKIDPSVWVFLKIILAVAGVLILYFAFTGIKYDMDRNAEVRKVESRLEEYEKLVPEELPKLCRERGIGLDGTYMAKGFPELTLASESGSKYQFYSVKLDYEVTLQADEYFDSLDDRANITIWARSIKQQERRMRLFCRILSRILWICTDGQRSKACPLLTRAESTKCTLRHRRIGTSTQGCMTTCSF